MAPAPSFMQDQRGASNLDKAERAKLLGKDEEATGANALRMQGLGAAACVLRCLAAPWLLRAGAKAGSPARMRLARR